MKMASQRSPSFEEILERRLSRRDALRLSLAGAAVVAWPSRLALAEEESPVGFRPLPSAGGERVRVPDGHRYQVVARWGDPILAGAREFDPESQSVAAQERQLGANCDFVGFLPLPRGSNRSDQGLLCISSEFTNARMMWPGVTSNHGLSREQCDVTMAAHGLNIVMVRRADDGSWALVRDSELNRRVTATSKLVLTGPAAGHPRMRTSGDPSGRVVLGTVNNCSGGLTPWGTWLQAEENFNHYFSAGDGEHDDWTSRNLAEHGVPPLSIHGWDAHHPRFDVSKEPNEINRFGWVVEIDPHAPTQAPVKRTALGRFKHESATTALARDGRAVVYSGDDEYFAHVYKFVSSESFRPTDRKHSRRLLDSGVLYTARFDEDGRGEWLPLVFGHGPLTTAGGFADQAEVLIRTRAAAAALGATPMDRPEGMAANPAAGSVYLALTKNAYRTEEQVDDANPRAPNPYGHIVEIRESGEDPGATSFTWQLLLRCGPGSADGDAPALGCPDNLALDRAGGLWITTDGRAYSHGENDGVFVVPTRGVHRATAWTFLTAVPGAEVCGPCFTPDQRTFFCAIQHPGTSLTSSYEEPLSRFPDYREDMPPRASVVAVWRKDGGVVGE